jgi:hypothetical protein
MSLPAFERSSSVGVGSESSASEEVAGAFLGLDIVLEAVLLYRRMREETRCNMLDQTNTDPASERLTYVPQASETF